MEKRRICRTQCGYFPGPDGKTPGFTMNAAIREANASRSIPDAETRGQLYLGTKGTMVLAGNWEVLPEMKGDPVNDIPRFSGHPAGGPVYSDTKPDAVDRGVQRQRHGVGCALWFRRRRHSRDE